MNVAVNRNPASKVPAVTLGFWIVNILATTLCETGGDPVAMTMNLGYPIGTPISLDPRRPGVVAGDGQAFSPVPVLGDDHRLHDRGHDHGRFRHALAGIG